MYAFCLCIIQMTFLCIIAFLFDSMNSQACHCSTVLPFPPPNACIINLFSTSQPSKGKLSKIGFAEMLHLHFCFTKQANTFLKFERYVCRINSLATWGIGVDSDGSKRLHLLLLKRYYSTPFIYTAVLWYVHWLVRVSKCKVNYFTQKANI